MTNGWRKRFKESDDPSIYIKKKAAWVWHVSKEFSQGPWRSEDEGAVMKRDTVIAVSILVAILVLFINQCEDWLELHKRVCVYRWDFILVPDYAQLPWQPLHWLGTEWWLVSSHRSKDCRRRWRKITIQTETLLTDITMEIPFTGSGTCLCGIRIFTCTKTQHVIPHLAHLISSVQQCSLLCYIFHAI